VVGLKKEEQRKDVGKGREGEGVADGCQQLVDTYSLF
jgi:hypothetical protein